MLRGGGGSVAIIQLGLYTILRTLLLGRGLYIVHETGVHAVFTGGGLLRWQVKSGSATRFLEEARHVYVM